MIYKKACIFLNILLILIIIFYYYFHFIMKVLKSLNKNDNLNN